MREKRILAISYLYVFLPTVIFFLGWVKTWIAVPVCLLLVWSLKKAVDTDIELCLPVWNRRNIIRGIIILLIIAVWVFFSGIGNFVWQNQDHTARNALYEMLVANEWPVVKSVVYEDGIQQRGLIYYIGYWLPAAVTGKIFGVSAGYFFQYIWAVLGISIGAVLLNSSLKQWSVSPVILFVFFSGLDAVGCVLGDNLKLIFSFAHLEWWNRFQFSGFTTQLYWVFNQAIYAWVLFALIMKQKNNRRILCLWSLGLITCTFPTAGMTPFVLYMIVKNRKADGAELSEGKAAVIYGLMSFENVLGGIVGMICSLYLTGNLSVQNSALPVRSTAPIRETEDGMYFLFNYILFILIEIGVYYIYIYRRYKKNRLFYISLFSLLICPLVKVGNGGDFCMRASIPSLLILFCMVAKSFQEDMKEKNIARYVIVAALVVGSITAVHEVGRSVTNTVQQYRRDHEVVNPITSEEKILQSNNFSGEIQNNLFFTCFSK